MWSAWPDHWCDAKALDADDMKASDRKCRMRAIGRRQKVTSPGVIPWASALVALMPLLGLASCDGRGFNGARAKQCAR